MLGLWFHIWGAPTCVLVAHVRLGATMASEFAEKRRAIAWVGLSDGRDVDSSDPGSEESLHFS